MPSERIAPRGRGTTQYQLTEVAVGTAVGTAKLPMPNGTFATANRERRAANEEVKVTAATSTAMKHIRIIFDHFTKIVLPPVLEVQYLANVVADQNAFSCSLPAKNVDRTTQAAK